MPDVGRFFNIDPLSEKYVHNGVYNFSENRVIDSRELEGLEAVKSIDGNVVTVTVRIKPINNSLDYPVTNKQINNAMNNFASQTKSSYSGLTTNGMQVNVNVINDPDATLTVNIVDNVNNPNIDISNTDLQVANYFAPGFTDEKSVGNTDTGTIQLSSMNSTFEGSSTDAKPGAGGTITHELGHIFGLPDNNPSVPKNLMNSPKESTDRTITPEQRDKILENIPTQN